MPAISKLPLARVSMPLVDIASGATAAIPAWLPGSTISLVDRAGVLGVRAPALDIELRKRGDP
jgi:hypothetical protein